MKTLKLIVFAIVSVKLVISVEFPNISDLKFGEYQLMSTSKFNQSFSHTIGKWSPNINVGNSTETYLEIDRRNPYKMSEFLGFGCTFTDSDLEIFQQMPSTLSESVFENYFSAKELNFKLLRVPIDGNFELKRKIYQKPLLQRPSNEQLKIVGVVTLPNQMDSLMKFAKSINKIEILDLNFTEQAENVTDQTQQIRNLITVFNQSKTGFETPKICLTDYTSRKDKPWLFGLEKSQKNIFDEIDMISLVNHSVPPEFLCREYKKYRKPILFTKIDESKGFSTVRTDSWQKAEELIDSIISLLHQNIVGYFENSLISYATEMNTADTLLMFDENERKLRKLPAFYAMAHFSRHILPTSKRLAATLCGPMMSGIETVAYLRPDAKVMVLLYNSYEISIPVTAVDEKVGKFDVILPPKSINSIVYCI